MNAYEADGAHAKSKFDARVTEYDSSECASSDDAQSEDGSIRRNRYSRFISRLGTAKLFALASSFPVVFACLAFLTFLWLPQKENHTWRSIALSGWMTRSITVTSLVLRWATAAQAIICTSMLAAVLLQEHSVPLPKAAAVSMLRFENTGPWSLVQKMLRRWHHRAFEVAFLAVMLSITTMLLQFTSTALLSEVGRGLISVSKHEPSSYYGVNIDGLAIESDPGSRVGWFATTPSEYPAFAEYKAGSVDASTSARNPWPREVLRFRGPTVKDTGTVMRAFLPIRSPEERTHLVSYRGMATVVDTRVVCMRPVVRSADLVFAMPSNQLSGRVDASESIPRSLRAPRRPQAEGFSFNCRAEVDAPQSAKNGQWSLSLCPLPVSPIAISSVMDPVGKEKMGQAFLLVNTTTASDAPKLGMEALLDPTWQTIPADIVRDDDTGQGHHSPDKVWLQFTLCLTAFDAQELEVDASRPENIHPEPTLEWNVKQTRYVTAPILRQRGDGHRKRGIFHLDQREWHFPTTHNSSTAHTGAWYATTAVVDQALAHGPLTRATINAAQYAVLTDTLAATRDPALALQSYFTTLFSLAYHDRLPKFDAAAPSTRAAVVEALVPAGWAAYRFVLAVTAFHAFLALLATASFARLERRGGALGDAWCALAQVLGAPTERWIRDADAARDRDVEAWMRRTGVGRTMVKLGEVDGRVVLVPVEGGGEGAEVSKAEGAAAEEKSGKGCRCSCDCVSVKLK